MTQRPGRVDVLVPIHVAPIEQEGSLPDDIPACALIVLRHRALMDLEAPDVALAQAVLLARERYPKAALGVPMRNGPVVEVVWPNRYWKLGHRFTQG